MNAQDVLNIIHLLTKHAITVHVDGGWAVDALLGEQTRVHADLDIAVPYAHVPALRQVLTRHGFHEVPRDDTWECNFVLQDPSGRLLDVHAYELDANGRITHGVPYPLESLTGEGVIAGVRVACISAEWLVRFHSGYELDEDDYRDVKALCNRFGFEMPDEFAVFVARDTG